MQVAFCSRGVLFLRQYLNRLEMGEADTNFKSLGNNIGWWVWILVLVRSIWAGFFILYLMDELYYNLYHFAEVDINLFTSLLNSYVLMLINLFSTVLTTILMDK